MSHLRRSLYVEWIYIFYVWGENWIEIWLISRKLMIFSKDFDPIAARLSLTACLFEMQKWNVMNYVSMLCSGSKNNESHSWLTISKLHIIKHLKCASIHFISVTVKLQDACL